MQEPAIEDFELQLKLVHNMLPRGQSGIRNRDPKLHRGSKCSLHRKNENGICIYVVVYIGQT